jgi:hypothetical protein
MYEQPFLKEVTGSGVNKAGVVKEMSGEADLQKSSHWDR